MNRPDRDFIQFDPFEGDKGGPEVRAISVRIVTTRKEHTCVFEEPHTIPVSSRVRYESALVDGKWRSYYMCLPCIDKWLDEVFGGEDE